LLQKEEARMRQALGLSESGADGPAQQRREQDRRRRFTREGEVPVVVLGNHAADAPPVNRVEMAEVALKAERGAREQAERLLREAQASLHALQTRLAHAELAHREELAAERQARELAERALQDAKPAAVRAKPKRLGRPPTREPQPVKWWLPSRKKRSK